jgi:ribosomal protein S18 acetylase RimI-like enzyme
MKIRDGNENDLDLFFELWWINSKEHEDYNILDHVLPKEDIRKEVMGEQLKTIKEPNNIFIVAEEDTGVPGLKKIIGMASGHVGGRDEERVFLWDKEGYVDELFILSGSRMKGVGKKLLHELISRLYENGADFIGLGVAAQNPAVKFYEKEGFQIKSYWMTKQEIKK